MGYVKILSALLVGSFVLYAIGRNSDGGQRAAAQGFELGRRYTITADSMIACAHRDDFKRLIPLAAAKDYAAFAALRADLIGRGGCRDLVRGDPVFLDDRDWGLACLRPPGETRCVWTTVQAIR